MVEPADLLFVGVLVVETLPLIAASRLNGSDDDPRERKGGSMRVKGAETRRFFEMPPVFLGGERPAGAVRGARGDEMLDRAGVRAGGGIDFTGVMEKVKGFSHASLLLFLEGENIEGSAFSESTSSSDGVKERLPVFLAGDADGINGLPLKGELFARKPKILST